MKKFFILLSAIFSTVACLKEECPFHYTIHINIVDATSLKEVNGANVYLYSKNESTLHKEREQIGVNGSCKFSDLERMGGYVVKVKCEDLYFDGESYIELDNNAEESINISLNPI